MSMALNAKKAVPSFAGNFIYLKPGIRVSRSPSVVHLLGVQNLPRAGGENPRALNAVAWLYSLLYSQLLE